MILSDFKLSGVTPEKCILFPPGDGTFDSPGFTAYYCTYYVLDLSTKKVLALWVATKEMVTMMYNKCCLFIST